MACSLIPTLSFSLSTFQSGYISSFCLHSSLSIYFNTTAALLQALSHSLPVYILVHSIYIGLSLSILIQQPICFKQYLALTAVIKAIKKIILDKDNTYDPLSIFVLSIYIYLYLF